MGGPGELRTMLKITCLQPLYSHLLFLSSCISHQCSKASKPMSHNSSFFPSPCLVLIGYRKQQNSGVLCLWYIMGITGLQIFGYMTREAFLTIVVNFIVYRRDKENCTSASQI